jgi:hypothetical protein
MRKLWEIPVRTILQSRYGAGWRRLGRGAGAALLVLIANAAALAAASPQQPAIQADGPTIWPVLLPLIALAIAIERAIELLWNYLEWLLIRFGRWQPGALKSPSYVHFKSGTSLLAGLGLGILVANYSGLRLLTYLQPFMPTFIGGLPAYWDILLTGVVLGAGAKPIHDLLGIITHLKNLTGNTALRQREQAGAALADGIVKLNQSGSPYTVDIPGLGSTRVPGAAAPSRSRGDGAPSTAQMKEHADLIHNKLYIGS